MKRQVAFLIVLSLLAVSAAAWAQNQGAGGNPGVLPPRFDPKKPIHIVADRMEADHEQRVVRFIGNVVAVQNDAVLNCDLLVINYRAAAQPPAGNGPAQPLVGLPEQGGEIEKLVAIGRVQMVQQNRRASCERAEYNRQRGTIELTGNPEIAQGQDILRGSKILIFVETQRVDVLGQGSQRVQVTINPRSAQQAVEQQQQQQQQRQDGEQEPGQGGAGE